MMLRKALTVSDSSLADIQLIYPAPLNTWGSGSAAHVTAKTVVLTARHVCVFCNVIITMWYHYSESGHSKHVLIQYSSGWFGDVRPYDLGKCKPTVSRLRFQDVWYVKREMLTARPQDTPFLHHLTFNVVKTSDGARGTGKSGALIEADGPWRKLEMIYCNKCHRCRGAFQPAAKREEQAFTLVSSLDESGVQEFKLLRLQTSRHTRVVGWRKGHKGKSLIFIGHISSSALESQ